MSLSKYMASTLALAVIKDETSDYHLPKICDCRALREAEQAAKKLASGRSTRLPAGDDMDEDINAAFGEASAAMTPSDTAAAASAPTVTGDVNNAQSTTLSVAVNVGEEAERLELQQEIQAFESFTKQPGDGDPLDQTEKGFYLRARVAAELFGDDVTSPFGEAIETHAEVAGNAVPATPAGTTDKDEDESWEPW